MPTEQELAVSIAALNQQLDEVSNSGEYMPLEVQRDALVLELLHAQALLSQLKFRVDFVELPSGLGGLAIAGFIAEAPGKLQAVFQRIREVLKLSYEGGKGQFWLTRNTEPERIYFTFVSNHLTISADSHLDNIRLLSMLDIQLDKSALDVIKLVEQQVAADKAALLQAMVPFELRSS